MTININGHKFKLLLKSAEISKRVRELGKQITKDYSGKEPVIIGVLKGSYVFLANLARYIEVESEIDFIRVSSYKDGMRPEEIELLTEIRTHIQDRHVLLVEDLLDTGNTLAFIKGKILSQSPASLKICALIKKKKNRDTEVSVDYVGFEIEDKFIVGYGTDFAEKGRNLPDIYVVER